MRRTLYFVMALALVLGLAQCKKEQTVEPENETKTVDITLKVGSNGGSKHDINTTTGAVSFQNGDVIYVGNGSTYIGTLTYDGTIFSGSIDQPDNNTEIYFYFVGGLTTTPADLTGQSSFTVDISDQSTKMPVLSCNHVTYSSGTTSYSCVLQNQCALVKFTTASGTDDPVHVGGLYTEAKIDFANNNITNNVTTGFVNLHPDAEDNKAKWAVLLPQTGFEDAEAAIAHVGYTTTIPTIAADAFITGDAAISISTPNNIVYLDWLTGHYTATNGKILTGKLAANVKVSIADGATVTLDGVTINGVHNTSYRWAGITCNGDATIILKDGTTNTVKGFHSNYPGIYVPTAHTLTIQGEGSLDAGVNTNDNGGAGIGAIYNSPCGNIEIQGGTVSATGGIYAAGIGGANKGACGNITISGGTVTANGGNASAGIGSGYYNTSSCGNITISGGTVTANGTQNGAGIGTGENSSCGSILISGGTVTARGSWNGSGIGCGGTSGSSGAITILNTVKRVTAVKGGYGGSICIGHSQYGGSCGTVTIGGTVYSGGATPNQTDNKTFIYPNIPEGAINAHFSVSDTQKIYFSQGNLQATTTNNGSTWTWSFATNQWDYIGNAAANNAINGNGTVSTNGSIDLFCWSTNASFYGINNSTDDYGYSGTFIEWGNIAISNGGNTENSGWRTLTINEWGYLFNSRTDAASKKGLGSVNGVHGLILLPDEWTLPDGLTFTAVNNSWANVYTTLQWAQMEANGAIFLPALGARSGLAINNLGSRGDYWSSSAGTNNANARSMYFQINKYQPSDTSYRRSGRGVRLVRNV